MSQRRGYIEDFELDSAFEDVSRWVHIPLLALLMLGMFLVRINNWQEYVSGNQVLFSGNDAWYHFRQVSYTVSHWPQTMPFDPWTHFPYGTSSAQFGSLFDQLIATVALVVGLGSPSEQTVAMTLLFAPAVFGTLVAIPLYFAGKAVGGKISGVVAVLILALSTGSFFVRSSVGFADHHVGEVFFSMIAIAAFLVALTVATEERPVWELVVNREWDALRRPLGYAILAGVGIGLYIWVWPPALLLVGILGIYFAIQLTIDYLHGKSPDHVAFVGVVALGVAGLLSFVPLKTIGFSGVDFTLLQPLMALAVAGGCAYMAWLARQFDSRDVPKLWYPVAVLGTAAVAMLLVRVLIPDLFTYLVKNVQRTVALGGGARAGTVGEASPLRNAGARFIQNFGAAHITAAMGGLVALYYVARNKKYGEHGLFFVVWGVIMVFATLTQSRFAYYLVFPFALLNAFLIARISEFISPPETVSDIQLYQVLTVLIVIAVVVMPLGMVSATPWTQMERGGPGGVQGWNSSLNWMAENTPVPGTYGGAENEMEFYGTYDRTDDYDYPEGAYGVMSWWDYGHWITQHGKRIPNANPFQQGAEEAAKFLLAQNETRAGEVLGQVSEEDAKTRYVMIDWKMANTWGRYGGKFFAPTVFHPNVSQGDFVQPVYNNRGRPAYHVRSQQYYQSMVNRLWHFHGSAQRPTPFVVDYEERSLPDGRRYLATPRNAEPYQFIRNRSSFSELRSISERLSNAREFVDEDGSAQVGGVGPNPPRYVDALEHYRLVHNSETLAYPGLSGLNSSLTREQIGLAGGRRGIAGMTQQERRLAQLELRSMFFPDGPFIPWTKTFERVEGATIKGTGPANTNVTALVTMETPSTRSTFTYRQRTRTNDQGEFNMTVPYSTTGYDNWGPEDGYTNTSVRAAGQYNLTTPGDRNETHVESFTANATVTEAQVIGEDESATTVELTKEVRELPGAGNQTDGNESVPDSADAVDNSTADTSSDGDGNGTNETTPNGQSAVAPPIGVGARPALP